MGVGYTKYMHVEKLGSGEVEGILDGTCYLFYKIDGTNACVWYDDGTGTLQFGSRNRQLGEGQDNAGFREAMLNDPGLRPMYMDLLNFLSRHRNLIVYGEWLVPTNIRRYREDAWRKFYVFDVYDTVSGTYMDYGRYSRAFDSEYPNILYIPMICKMENPTEEGIRAHLKETGNYLISTGVGEGIVIKNYNYRNPYGRITWAKVLTEDFLADKREGRGRKRVAQESGESMERNIIKLMTVDHVLKEKAKIMENRGSTTWEQRFIPELLNRAFNEFFRDNWETILKKFHNPTIDFKTLKRYSDEFVKSIIL